MGWFNFFTSEVSDNIEINDGAITYGEITIIATITAAITYIVIKSCVQKIKKQLERKIIATSTNA